MVMKLKRKYQTSNKTTKGVAFKRLPPICFIFVWFVFSFYVFYYMPFICILTAFIVFSLVLYHNDTTSA